MRALFRPGNLPTRCLVFHGDGELFTECAHQKSDRVIALANVSHPDLITLAVMASRRPPSGAAGFAVTLSRAPRFASTRGASLVPLINILIWGSLNNAVARVHWQLILGHTWHQVPFISIVLTTDFVMLPSVNKDQSPRGMAR